MKKEKCKQCNGVGLIPNHGINIAIGVFPIPLFNLPCPDCNGKGYKKR